MFSSKMSSVSSGCMNYVYKKLRYTLEVVEFCESEGGGWSSLLVIISFEIESNVLLRDQGAGIVFPLDRSLVSTGPAEIQCQLLNLKRLYLTSTKRSFELG